ncbi:unnamed protein product, partial [marine sediment metagenome]
LLLFEERRRLERENIENSARIGSDRIISSS